MLTEVIPAYESEKTLIGGLLLDCSLFSEIKNKLCPADFFDEAHKTIFESMYRVYAARGLFDPAMISDDCGANINYLCALANDCCSIANLKAHTDIIREKSVQRALIECAKQIEDVKE